MAAKITANMRWIIAFGLVLIPLLSANRYLQDIAIMTFLWSGLTSSWNLNCGYSRRLSIGHGAFFGIGAYSSSLLFVYQGISPWIGMIAGALISAAAAFILGRATLRLKGTFFVLSTIAFAEIIRILAVSLKDLTGGSMGILIPYEPGLINMAWNSKIPFAIITWLYMLLMLYICVRMERSRFGYYLIAIGEDRESAETLRVDSTKIMVTSFITSAFFTSIGGSIFAQYIMYIEPHSVMGMVQSSLQFILIGIIGGLGKAFGPFVGAIILIPLSTLLRGYFTEINGLHGLMYGVIMLAVVLWKPDGMIVQINLLYQTILKKLGLGGDEK
ncbi:MAG TPA: branched-chain amino acid ABC transporter permease [Anaerovoracaceae bacterium]|nr:branched-chain amino acid ABC transporter permease [Anaerovoracaceae bacterium]